MGIEENIDCEGNLFKLNNTFSYGFTSNLSLVPEGFPEPILQFEFEAIIPWVIY